MKRALLLAIMLAFVFSASLVRADQLDLDLQTVWEAIWDERGTPRTLVRWKKSADPISYRITGVDVNKHRAAIKKTLDHAASLAGIQFADISDRPDAATQSQVNIDIGAQTDAALHEQQVCFVMTTAVKAGYFDKVTMRLRTDKVWYCIVHETMHLFGVPGHPRGDTVLSYFAGRTDIFQPLDELMIRALYDKKLSGPITPFQALDIFTSAAAEQANLGIEPSIALERKRKFLSETMAEMEAFAAGHGEIPSIVKRSGKASGEHMKNAPREIAFYLAIAYTLGSTVTVDKEKALRWLTISAEAEFSGAQYLLGNSYFEGDGVVKDQVLGYRWLQRAAGSDNPFFKAALAKAEKTLSADELTALRKAVQP